MSEKKIGFDDEPTANAAGKSIKPIKIKTKTKEPIPRSGSYRQYGYGRMYGV